MPMERRSFSIAHFVLVKSLLIRRRHFGFKNMLAALLTLIIYYKITKLQKVYIWITFHIAFPLQMIYYVLDRFLNSPILLTKKMLDIWKINFYLNYFHAYFFLYLVWKSYQIWFYCMSQVKKKIIFIWLRLYGQFVLVFLHTRPVHLFRERI